MEKTQSLSEFLENCRLVELALTGKCTDKILKIVVVIINRGKISESSFVRFCRCSPYKESIIQFLKLKKENAFFYPTVNLITLLKNEVMNGNK